MTWSTRATPLKLYSIYGPPDHPDGTVHVTKAEAEEAEATEHGHDAHDHHADALE